MIILSGFFVLFSCCGVFFLVAVLVLFVCLFFFGTGTLALLDKQKLGNVHACSVSYGAKDRNIVRKSPFSTWYVSSFGLLCRFGTTAHCGVKNV